MSTIAKVVRKLGDAPLIEKITRILKCLVLNQLTVLFLHNCTVSTPQEMTLRIEHSTFY